MQITTAETVIKHQWMRFRQIFILFAVIILSASCADKVQFDTHFTSFKQLNKHFDDVPNAYRPVPFWVWNADMTMSVIDEQLEDFADKGFGGVFVHPRYGLITEYVSEEWYGLVEYATKRARRLGLDLWLYDENSFPSGFAGGHVPAEMPESYNEGHALRMHRQQILQPDSTKAYLLIFSAQDSLVDITASWEPHVGERGSFLLFEKVYYPVSDWYAGYSYVDLLRPGVTEKFIEVTMDGYEEHSGSFFGNVIPGVFTDEPHIAPQGGGELIRWTPDLFERFYERWGYRLEPHLAALVEQHPKSGQVRHNYYQLLLELFIDRWSRPWYNYTEENQLAWTGHYWEHNWPSPHFGPDDMAMYAWHQVPGIDMLFNAWQERPGQFGNIRAVRELNSVGNQLGRVRKLSETYGASGWELTFEDMKRNGDWEFVLGVNLMNQHLSYQSILGDRKHDFPQSFSHHAPYWEEYPVLNTYFGRLSLALSSGQQLNRTLILEPTTSVWMNYQPGGGQQDHLNEVNEEFRTLLALLESEQVEYDLGSENIIRDHGSVEDDLLVIGERKYNFVVIPQFMTNLNSETAALIEQYLAAGGIIIALCEPPAFIDGKANDKCLRWTENYIDQWYSLGGCNDPRLLNYLHRDDFVIVEQQGGDLFHMRRQLEGGQLLFLVNSSKDESCSVSMLSQGRDIAHMDLFTGKVEQYPGVLSGNIISFDAELDPCGSILLFIGENEVPGKVRRQRKWNGLEEEVSLSSIETTVTGRNALNLDYCRVILDNDTSSVKYFYAVQTDIFRHHGFESNPWASTSQYRKEIIERDTFSSGSGFTAQYPFFVDTDFISAGLSLVVERPHLYEVRINNTLLEPESETWWLDQGFGVFRIEEGILPGENYIKLKADPMSVYCELEPVYLLGDFDVLPLSQGWLLATATDRTLGSWKDAGMPFYSDKVKYSASFELEKTGMAKVVMPDWHGTVAEVHVNGNPAGNIFTRPYTLRIDQFIRKGENQVKVTIYGSLKNLLGPHHHASTKGIVTPRSFRRGPAEQPPGIEYDLVDYGLFEPFVVEVISE